MSTEAFPGFSREALLELSRYRMPFGKYKGRLLLELPLPYLIWFRQRGFPGGKLGDHLQSMLVVKENGLDSLIRDIRKEFPGENP